MRQANTKRRTGPRAQRGQALAEMAIAAAVIVPLFLLVPTLGKYFHMKQTAQQAARSAAWSATVRENYDWNGLGNDHVRERDLALDRHFGRALDPIRTQPSNAGANTDVRNEMMNSFSNRHLIRRSDVTMNRFGNQEGGQMSQALAMVEALPCGSFPPNQRGLVSSEIVLRPRNLQNSSGGAARFLDPFHNIDLEMRGQHTVLADSWNAAGSGIDESPSNGKSRGVHEQVKTLVITGCGEGLGEVLEDLSFLEILPVLGTITRLRPGYIEPDIVPRDKLERYRAR
jgi:hypothetical protein